MIYLRIKIIKIRWLSENNEFFITFVSIHKSVYSKHTLKIWLKFSLSEQEESAQW